MEKEAIFLKPIFKDYIWGGQKLKNIFKKEVENEECTAESWEISTNSNGETQITNGKYKNKTLTEIYNDKEIRKEIFGTKCINLEDFPLLIKFIDANDCLSVQVHPDNEYALKNENSQGKTEMWYILDCEEGAQIICGVKEGISIEELKNSINENKITESLNYIDVHKGDAIYIPSGTIHALLGKTLVAEVQQNSNITYRVYDWGRTNKEGKPRELHINKALEVIKTENRPQIQNIKNDIVKLNIVKSEFFITNKINVTEEYQEEISGETFIAFNVIEGKGELVIEDKIYKIEKGESFIIPANVEKYKILGEVQLLQSFI
ncbi:MAG: class I mannose-6-phosphate isomerase [Clostridia bacterium]|nr:class I mannose-6-phosphate isomerase [Clostridia bacterium]